jgi:Uma2 family endonuclease
MSDNSLARFFETYDFPDEVRVEFLDGEIIMQANPMMVHDLPGRRLVRETPQPFEAWNERGIFISEDDLPRADAVIIRGGDWSDEMRDLPASIVLAVFETVSSGRAAVRRDYEDKREKYQNAGIPVYVIIDPRTGEWLVLQLQDGKYNESDRGVFGEPIQLPPPMGFAVSTASFHRYPAGPSA